MSRRYAKSLDRDPSRLALVGVPVASIILGSLAPALPIVADWPFLPPFGLLMLIAWRMMLRDFWPAWGALPLGLIDDMFSGQPIGSSAAIWTMVFLVIDLFDRGMMWRDYKQDWGLAAILIAAALSGGLWIANATGGDTMWLVIVPQILLTIALFPLAVRACAALDRVRWQL